MKAEGNRVMKSVMKSTTIGNHLASRKSSQSSSGLSSIVGEDKEPRRNRVRRTALKHELYDFRHFTLISDSNSPLAKNEPKSSHLQVQENTTRPQYK